MGDDPNIISLRPGSDVAEPIVVDASRMHRRYRGQARPDVLAVVAAGGMLGASARYGVDRWLPNRPGGFPWATFWANMAGSFLLGVILVLILERFPPTRYVRPFLASGILGAFTTMSTYEVETALLIKDGHALNGLTYGLGSLVAGLVLGYSGILVGRLTRPRHHESAR
jgi:CrcB protein